MDDDSTEAFASLTVHPIGLVRSPFKERSEAPRQPSAARGVEGRIELFAASGIDHALEDLESFDHIWVLFWFHRNEGFRPKVLPPRSSRRRGVFATRSPYRPNPIGMSVVELVRVEQRVLVIRNLDMLDETPVLDIKPYVAYVDAIPTAKSGWLAEPESTLDPIAAWEVRFSETALEQLAFVRERQGVEYGARVQDVLKLGPTPHPYRRIKAEGSGWVLALKDWRFCFRAEAACITVTHLRSGYRPSELFGTVRPELSVHREFTERFGASRLP